MDIFEAIESRVSVRNYDKRDVPNELIAHLLFAATYAQSAGDLQPWEFVVVKNKKTKHELSIAALRQKHVEDAPVVIVVLANLERGALKFKDRGKELYTIQDIGAAIQNMLLVAHALGLGACWVRAFEEEKVKALLKIPDKLRPLGIITVGFPLPYEKPYKTEFIPFENISWSEEYGKKLTWFKDYGKPSRFKFSSIYETAKEIKEKHETRFERIKKFIRGLIKKKT